jgi:hypothetical protein
LDGWNRVGEWRVLYKVTTTKKHVPAFPLYNDPERNLGVVLCQEFGPMETQQTLVVHSSPFVVVSDDAHDYCLETEGESKQMSAMFDINNT